MAKQSQSVFNPYAHQRSQSCLFNQALQTWKGWKHMSISHSSRATRVKKKIALSHSELGSSLKQIRSSEMRWGRWKSPTLPEVRGGEAGLMRCKWVAVCSTADSWSTALTGNAVTPTSPNKHPPPCFYRPNKWLHRAKRSHIPLARRRWLGAIHQIENRRRGRGGGGGGRGSSSCAAHPSDSCVCTSCKPKPAGGCCQHTHCLNC